MKTLLATLMILAPLSGTAAEEFTSVSNLPVQYYAKEPNRRGEFPQKKCFLLNGGHLTKVRDDRSLLQVELSYTSPAGISIDKLLSGCSSGNYTVSSRDWEGMLYAANPDALAQRLEKRNAALEARNLKVGDRVFLAPVDPALNSVPSAPCRLHPQSVEVLEISATGYKFRSTLVDKYDFCDQGTEFTLTKKQAGDWYAGEERNEE